MILLKITEKWSSSPTPNLFQRDPTFYDADHRSSGNTGWVCLIYVSGDKGTHLFVATSSLFLEDKTVYIPLRANKSEYCFIRKNGNLHRRRVHSNKTRRSTTWSSRGPETPGGCLHLSIGGKGYALYRAKIIAFS